MTWASSKARLGVGVWVSSHNKGTKVRNKIERWWGCKLQITQSYRGSVEDVEFRMVGGDLGGDWSSAGWTKKHAEFGIGRGKGIQKRWKYIIWYGIFNGWGMVAGEIKISIIIASTLFFKSTKASMKLSVSIFPMHSFLCKTFWTHHPLFVVIVIPFISSPTFVIFLL